MNFIIQNRERVASKVHRQETLDGLKKFNARRKLKVIAVFSGMKAENFAKGNEAMVEVHRLIRRESIFPQRKLSY